jgi:hypothetical protein
MNFKTNKKTKQIFMILFAFVALQISAQGPGNNPNGGKPNGKNGFFKDLSADQIATIKTKKLVLILDLSKSQETKIYDLNLNIAKTMKSKQTLKNKKGKPSSEERYSFIIQRLDNQIAVKKEFKSILTDEQFVKWEKIQIHKKRKQFKRQKKA